MTTIIEIYKITILLNNYINAMIEVTQLSKLDCINKTALLIY